MATTKEPEARDATPGLDAYAMVRQWRHLATERRVVYVGSVSRELVIRGLELVERALSLRYSDLLVQVCTSW
jgi:hypothetical protein